MLQLHALLLQRLFSGAEKGLFQEFAGGFSEMLGKGFGKIRGAVESALVGDLCNVSGIGFQEVTGFFETQVANEMRGG